MKAYQEAILLVIIGFLTGAIGVYALFVPKTQYPFVETETEGIGVILQSTPDTLSVIWRGDTLYTEGYDKNPILYADMKSGDTVWVVTYTYSFKQIFDCYEYNHIKK